MLYKGSITIPANTPKTDPTSAYLHLSEGVVKRWLIGFPPGCAGLVHVAIYRHEQKVLPEGEGDALTWDSFIFDVAESLYLTEPPYRVKIVAWNDDDSYPHQIFVGVEVMPVGGETTESLLSRLLHALVGA